MSKKKSERLSPVATERFRRPRATGTWARPKSRCRESSEDRKRTISVIMAVFHSASTRMLHLSRCQSENACTRKAASVVELVLSVSRSWELPFLPYRYKLENVAVSFVFELLVCSKSELVQNFQLQKELRIVDQGQYLSVRIVINIEDCTIKNCEA